MKACVTLAALALVSCSAVPNARQEADARDHQIAVLVGQRTLDEDLYDDADVDSQFVWGVEYMNAMPQWPVGLEVGFLLSDEDGSPGGNVDVESQITELYAGARYPFETGNPKLVPYVAGGLSWISTDVDVSAPGFDESDDDSSIALYVRGGIAYEVAKAFTIGADLRYLFMSDLEVFDETADADYLQLALTLGYGF